MECLWKSDVKFNNSRHKTLIMSVHSPKVIAWITEKKNSKTVLINHLKLSMEDLILQQERLAYFRKWETEKIMITNEFFFHKKESFIHLTSKYIIEIYALYIIHFIIEENS